MTTIPEQYWSWPTEELLAALDSTTEGLGSAEESLKLAQVGPNGRPAGCRLPLGGQSPQRQQIEQRLDRF